MTDPAWIIQREHQERVIMVRDEAIRDITDEVERLRAGIEAHRDAVRSGLLGKAEQDAADAHLWSLLEVTP